MPGNGTRWFWVTATIGASLVALAYGCVSEDRVVAPRTSSAPTLAPQLAGDGGGGFSLIGDYFLPAPPNSFVGTPWAPTSITIPPGVIARITVSGMLVFEPNPAYSTCSGHGPQPLPYGPVIGPSGFSSVPFPFRVNIFLSNATTPPPARITLLPEDPAAETVVGYLQGFGAGVLWARRDGWGFACGSAAEYLLSGGATIVAEAVPPSELVPDATSVKPGDTVTFHLNVPWTNEIQLGEGWRWIPDAGGSATTIVSGCRVGDMTCRFAVREKGHARLGGILLKSSFFIAAVSPTIEVNPDVVTITALVTTYLPDLSFTAKGSGGLPESQIRLHADVNPPELGPRVIWQFRPDTHHFASPPFGGAQPVGADGVFIVTPLSPDRWEKDHKKSLELAPKQFSYLITASVEDDQGQTHTSDTVTATQDEIDTMREEYIELGLGVPERGSFAPHLGNTGDYSLARVNLLFDVRLSVLQFAWNPLPLPAPAIYRNPVHNAYHLHVSQGSGAVTNSWHQYGCAADLGTGLPDNPTPAQREAARQLWTALHDVAVGVGFTVEPRDPDPTNPKRSFSSEDHVHVERRCPL